VNEIVKTSQLRGGHGGR